MMLSDARSISEKRASRIRFRNRDASLQKKDSLEKLEFILPGQN